MRRLQILAVLVLATTLASCGWLQRVMPSSQRAAPAATAAAPATSASQAGLPGPRGAAAACTREGETCKAAGSECCPGMICTGSASGICISRH